jgi:hypothetical protein
MNWRRSSVGFKQLPDIMKRLQELEKKGWIDYIRFMSDRRWYLLYAKLFAYVQKFSYLCSEIHTTLE